MKSAPILALLGLAVCGLAATAAAAAAETSPLEGDWLLAGESPNSVMFVLPAPGADETVYPRYLVRFEERVPFDRRGFSSMSSLELNEVDCPNQRTRIIHVTRYAERNLSGATRDETDAKPAWQTEEKGSFGAAILSAACGSGDEDASPTA